MKSMTVKELKLLLEKIDEDALVFIQEDDLEQGCILVTPRVSKGTFETIKMSFTDAFDSTSYATEVNKETFDGKQCYILR